VRTIHRDELLEMVGGGDAFRLVYKPGDDTDLEATLSKYLPPEQAPSTDGGEPGRG
jgi:hypothetical protein